jgi:hypothetical protein
LSDERIKPKHEPEVLRAQGKKYVRWCNAAVQDAPWTEGDTSTRSGVLIALELAEKAFKVHKLAYVQGLSSMARYDPRRFTWIYDPLGEAEDCIKVRDDETGKVAVWPL